MVYRLLPVLHFTQHKNKNYNGKLSAEVTEDILKSFLYFYFSTFDPGLILALPFTMPLQNNTQSSPGFPFDCKWPSEGVSKEHYVGLRKERQPWPLWRPPWNVPLPAPSIRFPFPILCSFYEWLIRTGPILKMGVGSDYHALIDILRAVKICS